MNNNEEIMSLHSQLCFPIYLCSKELIRRYTPMLEKLDLTYTQYIVMMFLWEKKSGNVTDISKVLLLDSGTLTPLLKKLENKGYITRERSKVDERNLNVKITEEGLALKKKATKIPTQIDKIINLTEKEQKELYALICKVLLNVNKEE